MAPLAITPGDPGGIGLDLCLQAALDGDLDGVVIADPQLVQARAQQLGLPVSLQDAESYDPNRTQGRLYIEPISAAHPDNPPGVSDPANAGYCLSSLDAALAGIEAGHYSGLVTGPVNKATIRDGGYRQFTGHTEYLRDHFGLDEVVMMLASADCRVALVTTHLPLADVPAAITTDRVLRTAHIVHRSLISQFALPHPRVAVLGLNPHAGESGHLGTEERDILEPAMARLEKECPETTWLGPMPADTAFQPDKRQSVDAYLAMYHDQALPVVKYHGFGAVNITLGLPIIRTSVDHGTALELAGTGMASTQGLVAAVAECKRLVSLQQNHSRA